MRVSWKRVIEVLCDSFPAYGEGEGSLLPPIWANVRAACDAGLAPREAKN